MLLMMAIASSRVDTGVESLTISCLNAKELKDNNRKKTGIEKCIPLLVMYLFICNQMKLR